MKRHSRKHGTIMAIVLAVVAIVVVIGIGLIYLMTIFGGRNELQNAVDAGALSVARRCLTDIFVKADQSASGFYDDVANSKLEINLENANRCLAKAMLVMINQEAMSVQNESTDQSADHAAEIFDSARRFSSSLDQELSNFTKLQEFFSSVANANSLRMLGNVEMKLQSPIERAYLDRGEKSSVYFYPNELPEGFNAANLQGVSKSDRIWLPGYVPLDIGSRGFNFVPQPIQPPHLVSERYFAANRQKPVAHGTHSTNDFLPVIANSYRLAAIAAKHQSTACSQADSVRDGFPMEMPHAFIRIHQPAPLYLLKIHENAPMRDSGNWGKEKPFTPQPNDPIVICYKAIKPKLDALPTAWEVFNSKQYAEVVAGLKTKFEQRAKEILPGAVLSKADPPFAHAAVKEDDFTYCFRAKNQLWLRDEQQSQDIIANALWLPPIKDTPVDGMANNVDQITIKRTNYFLSLPCSKDVSVGARVESIYFFQWVPATGARSVLGEILMRRNVIVRFLLPKDPPSSRYFKDDPPLEPAE